MKLDFKLSVSRAHHKKALTLSNFIEKNSAFYLFIYEFS